MVVEDISDNMVPMNNPIVYNLTSLITLKNFMCYGDVRKIPLGEPFVMNRLTFVGNVRLHCWPLVTPEKDPHAQNRERVPVASGLEAADVGLHRIHVTHFRNTRRPNIRETVTSGILFAIRYR